jgi:hypothetical protein
MRFFMVYGSFYELLLSSPPPDSPWNLHSSLFCSTPGATTDNTQEPGRSFKKIGVIYEWMDRSVRHFVLLLTSAVQDPARKSLISAGLFSKLNQR